MSKSLNVIGVVLVIALTSGAALLVSRHLPASAVPKCTAGPGELCPSDSFYRDFERWSKLKKKVEAQQDSSEAIDAQNQADEFSGMTQRLVGQVPKGYDWSEEKRKFLARPAPPAPAPTAPAKP